MKAFLLVVCLTAGASALREPLTDQQLVDLYGYKPVPNLSSIKLRYLNGGLKAPNQTLRQAAAGRVYIGSELNYANLHNDQTYATIGIAEYDLTTAENECKFPSVEPQRNQFTTTQCDYIRSAMMDTGGVFRLHNMVWGSQNPNWLLNGGFNAATLLDIMQTHMKNVGGAFIGKNLCWDVVNEAIADGGGSNVFKNSPPWYPAIQDYVDQAFTFAREVDPNAKLFYNEYGAEGSGAKSDKVYNMVKGMQSRGIPIDGVGMQMHISTTSYPSAADFSANIARVGALGLDVHVTEMDVKCAPCDANGLATQAKIYGDLLQACLQQPACKVFETWGFTDKYTWVMTDNHPLPFNETYGRKPAYYEMLAVLQANDSDTKNHLRG